jgi:hypothetical protein
VPRTKRRPHARAIASMAVAAVGLASLAAVIPATASAREQPPPAAAVIDPPLRTAAESAAVRAMGRAVMEGAAAERADRESIWDAIAACETQGDWSMRGSAYSGGLGFANGSWTTFGGLEFAPNAGQATRDQQIIVAERIRSSVGLGAWGCAKRLGFT